MKYLAEEKDYALKDYLSKIGGNEKNIQILQREKQELQRLSGNKNTENEDMNQKINKMRERGHYINEEYEQAKDMNDEFMRNNQNIKGDIVELEDRIQVEKDKSFELRGIKDKSNHTIYKTVSENEEARSKVEELERRLNGNLIPEQKSLEDKYRYVDKASEDIEIRLDK